MSTDIATYYQAAPQPTAPPAYDDTTLTFVGFAPEQVFIPRTYYEEVTVFRAVCIDPYGNYVTVPVPPTHGAPFEIVKLAPKGEVGEYVGEYTEEEEIDEMLLKEEADEAFTQYLNDEEARIREEAAEEERLQMVDEAIDAAERACIHDAILGDLFKMADELTAVVSKDTLTQYNELTKAITAKFTSVENVSEVTSTIGAIRDIYNRVEKLESELALAREQMDAAPIECREELRDEICRLEIDIARETTSCLQSLADDRGKEFLLNALRVFTQNYHAAFKLQQGAHIVRKKILSEAAHAVNEFNFNKLNERRAEQHKRPLTRKEYAPLNLYQVADKMPHKFRVQIDPHETVWKVAHNWMDTFMEWRKRVIAMLEQVDESFVDPGIENVYFVLD